MKLGDAIGWAGIGLFVLVTANFLCGYGTRWEFGPWGMPATLLDESGTWHPDGSAVEGVTLALARSGYEQQVHWAFAVLVAGLAFIVWLQMRRLYRTKLAILERELQERLFSEERHD